MVINPSLARGLSRRSMADWADTGARVERELTQLVTRKCIEVHNGRPPARVVKDALVELAKIMARGGLPGDLREATGRRHEALICFPEVVDGRVKFVLVTGTLNGRNGAIDVRRRRVFTCSQHALQRLHQRLGTQDPLALLREVYSSIPTELAMNLAVRVANAVHWPLPTARGLFICAPGENESMLLVTWMRRDQLGDRWGSIADDLGNAVARGSPLLEDTTFCVAWLRLHSQFLRPHAPGPDFASRWWDRRPGQEEDAEREIERSLQGETPPVRRRKAERHTLEPGDRYEGIVVQLCHDGQVVAVRNGFGMLRGANLPLAARVDVEVVEAVGPVYFGPRSVVLKRLVDHDDSRCGPPPGTRATPPNPLDSQLQLHRGPKGAGASRCMLAR